MFKVFYADEYGEVHFIKEEFESILNEMLVIMTDWNQDKIFGLLQIVGKIINHIVLIMDQI